MPQVSVEDAVQLVALARIGMAIVGHSSRRDDGDAVERLASHPDVKDRIARMKKEQRRNWRDREDI